MQKKQSTDVRKKQIARAAQQIIAGQGLSKFTSSAIAKAVGISEGALFRHVKNKEEIVLLVIDEMEEALFESFPPQDSDPLKRLGLFVEARIRLLSESPSMLQLFFSDQLMQVAGPEGVRRIRAMEAKSLDFVRSCLSEAAEQGLLKRGLRVPHAVLIVLGSIMAAVDLHRHQDLQRSEEIQKAKEDLWQTLDLLMRS